MNNQLASRFIGIVGALLLAACASSGEVVEVNVQDPHEGLNRSIYAFNDDVDTYVASPLVTGYQWILPDLLETALTNFFTNLKEPKTVLNDGLQGKGQQAGVDFERFLINTLLGFGGLIDVASYADIEYHEEDFDQTLAVWGVPRGDYLVLPLLGPSAYRTIPGEIVDAFCSPATYAIWPIQLLGVFNARSNAAQSLNFINEAAVDPYVFMRASYLQWRDYQITEGANTSDNLLIPGMDEMLDEEEEELKTLEIGL
ncbi:MAG: VacJ family lipoprotein [Methyloprofundus sp.]|nr:VacJ family lipoprotein [Methyloprofundus sp.]MDT8425068.1 VacJ family lipoprotein [Methyloprofundus sp.]